MLYWIQGILAKIRGPWSLEIMSIRLRVFVYFEADNLISLRDYCQPNKSSSTPLLPSHYKVLITCPLPPSGVTSYIAQTLQLDNFSSEREKERKQKRDKQG